MQRLLFFSLMILLSVTACRENVNDIIEEEIPHVPPVLEAWDEPYVPVKGDLTGLVSNEWGDPVAGAEVSLGDLSTTTNQFGFFLFKNVDLNARGSLVRIRQDGYFPGSRRVFAVNDAVNQVKIELIRKSFEYFFDAQTGGEVVMNGDAKILFAPNAIQRADGTPHTGLVRVAAKWLDPEALSTIDRMPGSLQGVTQESKEVVLGTVGMMVVELQATNGEKLNIRDGYTATIAMPVPSTLLPNPPASVPNWSYNEAFGVWVEEGTSQLEGNYYVGQVSHFSYWNHDFKGPLVEFTLSLVNEQDIPLEGFTVVIRQTETGLYGHGITCDRGVVAGLIPAELVLQLEVYGQCEAIIYEAEIGPFAPDTEIDLGVITLDATVINSTVTGSLINCDGDPIANGIVIIQFDGYTLIEYTDSTDFSVELSLCDQTENISIQAYDIDEALQSNTYTLPVEEQIGLGPITVCGQLENYIRLNVDGVQKLYLPAHASSPDSLNGATQVRRNYMAGELVIFAFNGQQAGDYSGEGNNFIEYIYDSDIGWSFFNNVFFDYFEVTSYGAIGEPVTGNFSGTLINGASQPPVEVFVTGDFSAIRTE
jgi:hypothetical protein